MKLIIDTDPGVDDAIAIALAVAMPQIDLLALTTAFGNTFVAQSSRNARFLLDMLGHDAPVAEGASLPYGETDYTPSANVHGPEGLGDFADIPQIGENASETAAELLVRSAREHAGELVICAVAPLTNIADALALDPAFAGNVKSLVIMGGALDCPGNITPHAEANIFHDAKAAEAVFGSDMNITMVGLDTTMQTLLTPDDFAGIAQRSPKVGGFLRDISEFYLGFYRSVGVFDGCPMHDAAAVLACTNPEKFLFRDVGVAVVQDGEGLGDTVADVARKPVAVAMGVDADWALEALQGHLATLP
jgi:inosine-uridine nucleoside N-ribohydrolase